MRDPGLRLRLHPGLYSVARIRGLISCKDLGNDKVGAQGLRCAPTPGYLLLPLRGSRTLNSMPLPFGVKSLNSMLLSLRSLNFRALGALIRRCMFPDFVVCRGWPEDYGIVITATGEYLAILTPRH
jgi:hypothetical protein